jgi:hypothetical protein
MFVFEKQCSHVRMSSRISDSLSPVRNQETRTLQCTEAKHVYVEVHIFGPELRKTYTQYEHVMKKRSAVKARKSGHWVTIGFSVFQLDVTVVSRSKGIMYVTGRMHKKPVM